MLATTNRAISIRELTPDDAPAIEQLFHRMSDRSRYLRFASATPRLTHRLRRHLIGMDGRRHVALGAFTRGPFAHRTLAGMANFIRTDDDVPQAEFAIAVADDVQRQGLGRLLLRALLDDAAHRGLHRLTFTALPENAGLLSLAASLGARYRIAGGLAEGHIRLCAA